MEHLKLISRIDADIASRMAPNSSLQSVIDGLIDRIADAIAARAGAGRSAAPAARSGRPSAKGNGRSSGARLCPVPGCGKPGAGPRNRFFCRDHARSLSRAEQNRLLAQQKAQPAAASSARKAGRPAGRKLDMSCRVAGCANTSRGPRLGFMCEKHSKELSKAEQRAAREKYNAKKAA